MELDHCVAQSSTADSLDAGHGNQNAAWPELLDTVSGIRNDAVGNVLVLESVLSFLQPGDLLRCRLVSHYWSCLATKLLGRIGVMVVLDTPGKVSKFAKQTAQRPQGIYLPYHNFKIRIVPTIPEKINGFARTIKLLHIGGAEEYSLFSGLPGLPPLFSRSTLSWSDLKGALELMVSLKELKLGWQPFLYKFGPYAEEGGLPIGNKSLECLSIYLGVDCEIFEKIMMKGFISATSTPTNVRRIFTYFSSIRKIRLFLLDNRRSSHIFLDDLEVVHGLEDLELEATNKWYFSPMILSHVPLKLKRFKADFSWWKGDEAVVFLNAVASTIEALSVRINTCAQVPNPVDLPHFPKLKILEMHSHWNGPLWTRTPPFLFIPKGDQFNNVTRLHISKDILRHFSTKPLRSVTELFLSSFYEEYAEVKELQHLNEVFQNIRKIGVEEPCFDELKAIFDNGGQHLEELAVIYSDVKSDSYLTGILDADLPDIPQDFENVIESWIGFIFLREAVDYFHKLPGLKKFELTTLSRCSISDTVGFCLSSIPALESLVLTNYEPSDTWLAVLKKKHKLVTLVEKANIDLTRDIINKF